MKSRTALLGALLILFSTLNSSLVFAQTDEEESHLRYQLGTSLFMLFNFSEESADYYLLNFGYQLSEKEIIFAEAWTWKYSEPMGSYGSSEELYPGMIRSFGLGAGYQRFLWKGLYATVEATPLILQYYDEDDNKIQKGVQLYCQLIAGYRFELFDEKFFIEPAYALKYWPVNTNVPQAFADVDEGTPGTIFEPSLNIGFKF